MNFVKINLQSITIEIPSAHAEAWEQILDEEFKIKVDRSEISNGIQYKSEKGISVTLWKKKADKVSTLLINGRKEYLTFVKEEIPKLYRKVDGKVNTEVKEKVKIKKRK